MQQTGETNKAVCKIAVYPKCLYMFDMSTDCFLYCSRCGFFFFFDWQLSLKQQTTFLSESGKLQIWHSLEVRFFYFTTDLFLGQFAFGDQTFI